MIVQNSTKLISNSSTTELLDVQNQQNWSTTEMSHVGHQHPDVEESEELPQSFNQMVFFIIGVFVFFWLALKFMK